MSMSFYCFPQDNNKGKKFWSYNAISPYDFMACIALSLPYIGVNGQKPKWSSSLNIPDVLRGGRTFFFNFIRYANKLQLIQFSRTFLEYVYWLVEQDPKIINTNTHLTFYKIHLFGPLLSRLNAVHNLTLSWSRISFKVKLSSSPSRYSSSSRH